MAEQKALKSRRDSSSCCNYLKVVVPRDISSNSSIAYWIDYCFIFGLYIGLSVYNCSTKFAVSNWSMKFPSLSGARYELLLPWSSYSNDKWSMVCSWLATTSAWSLTRLPCISDAVLYIVYSFRWTTCLMGIRFPLYVILMVMGGILLPSAWNLIYESDSPIV